MSFRGTHVDFELDPVRRPGKRGSRRRRRGRRAGLLALRLIATLAVLMAIFVIGVGYGRLTANAGAGSRRVDVRVDRGAVRLPVSPISVRRTQAQAG